MRIRYHLAGSVGRGVRVCGQVPQDVKDAALAAIDGPPEKKLETGPIDGSSCMPPGEDLASGLADQRLDTTLEDTAFHFDKTRGDPFPTSSTMLVGRAFKENTRQIRSWIMDDKVSTIGIYGMAGVGKTELLKHIRNEVLQSKDIPQRLY